MSELWTILVNNAFPAAVLAGFAFLVSRTFRRPALTHLLWVLVLIKLITPPLLPWSISVSPETAAVIGVSSTASTGAQATDGAAADVAPMAPQITVLATQSSGEFAPVKPAADLRLAVKSSAESASGRGLLDRTVHWLQTRWLLMFGVVWMTGTVISTTCIIRLLVRLRRRFEQAVPIDAESKRHVSELAFSLGLRRPPAVRLVEGIVSPLVWGVGPFTQIIFPRTLWEELPISSRDALLLHELAHYRRGDQWVRLLEIVVGCLYWWHPCVWWARRELAAAEEECCDAWVVRYAGHQPRSYAEAIITTLDYLAGEPVLRRPVTTGVNSMPVMKRRLNHIMRKTVSPVLPRPVRWSLFGAAAVMLPLQPFVQITPGGAADAALTADYQLQQRRAVSDVLVHELGSEDGLHEADFPDDLPQKPSGWWSEPFAGPSRSFLFSPNGRYRLELKGGELAALVDRKTDNRFDLTKDEITCLAFTPAGDRFVAGSRSGDVRLFDAERGHAVSTIVPPIDGKRVTSIDVGPDGTWAVSGNEAGSVMVWELGSGSTIATWTADSRINCVRVIDDQRIVVSTGRFYSPGSGQLNVLNLNPETLELETLFERESEKIIATIEPDDRSGTGLLLTDYAGDVWAWDGIGTESVIRGTVSRADIERAEFSNAFRLSEQL